MWLWRVLQHLINPIILLSPPPSKLSLLDDYEPFALSEFQRLCFLNCTYLGLTKKAIWFLHNIPPFSDLETFFAPTRRNTDE
jgi:hypothetical protein